MGRAYNPHHAGWYHGGWADPRGGASSNPHHASWYHGGWANSQGGTWDKGRDYAAWDKVRDYVREERAGDYATGLAWGLGGWASSGYGSGSGTDYSSGTGYGYGSGSGDAYANPSSDASSTDSGSSRTDAAQETKSASQQDGAAEERGYQTFDRARDAFKAGDYAAALELTDEALKDVPGDPLVHEFKALVLFARGEDARAAAELHAVLAVTPGMDWTTLSGLYPDVETYTGQLRALEDRCRRDPKAAAPRFVLAYHYLAAGHNDAAVAQLKALISLEPGDRVARRLLASLTGTPPAPPEPTTTRAVPDRDGTAGRPPSVDLVGRWRGERDGSTFDLSLDDRGRFLWQAACEGKAAATVSGAYAVSGDTLTLKAEDRPPLRTSVTELSPDSFRLMIVGGIPGDPSLRFRRAATPAAPDRDQRGGPRENR
jgi:tetratricopeptide (TPR) repeat protein